MKLYDITQRKPKNAQWCFIKEKSVDGKLTYIFSQPQCWYDDESFACHPRVVAWAPVPDHVSVNPDGWLSEYRGDSFPDCSCSCAVSLESSPIVRYAYFSAELGRFLAHKDVIAFMPI